MRAAPGRRGAVRVLAALLALAPAVGGAARAQAPGAVPDALLPYLAQSACLDARGAPVPGRLPFEPGCARRRPLSQGEPLPYRRHDWPAAEAARRLPQGYQASDAVLGTLLGRPAILHTLDFGDGPRRFGVFDAGRGDGGQALILRGGAAAAAMTEDAGGGVQWFASPRCRTDRGALPDGWLFAAAPLREAWTERVVRLSIVRRPDECPDAFGVSYTRWRRVPRLPVPWREAASGATGVFLADAVVSEHYGGKAIAAADHLERFFLARDLGMVRWERWENRALSRLPDRDRMARVIAESGRCPPMEASDPPERGWMLVDCRTWTNFVRAAPGAPLAAMAWPAPALR
jgi:hypothetical protein